jgi:type IV pilus assembly protein PilM
MRPVFHDLVTELQRSIGYFKSIDRSAKIGRILGAGNAMKLPGLQKFLAQNLDCQVTPITKFQTLTGDAVLNAPAFRNNLLTFGPAYGLVLQGLGRARLITNLMPREVVTKRIVREKKPWTIAAAAALLAACMVNYYGYWQSWRDTGDEGYKSAFQQADTVTRTASQFDSEYKSGVQELQTTIERGGQVVGDVERRLLWLELMRAINACLPHSDAPPSNDPAEISKREQIFITKFASEKFAGERGDLTAWWADMQIKQPENFTPSQGGSRGYGDGGYGYGASGASSGADLSAGVAVDAFAEPEEDAPPGPEGEGLVIELKGYHVHNGVASDEGAEFLKRTLLANLNGEKGLTLELPIPGETDPSKIEKVTLPELGISHAGIKYRLGPVDFEIPDPSQATDPTGTANAAGSSKDAATATTATSTSQASNLRYGMMEQKMIKLRRFDFIVQFAWKPTTYSQRVENRRKAEEERKAQEAEAAALSAEDTAATEQPGGTNNLEAAAVTSDTAQGVGG